MRAMAMGVALVAALAVIAFRVYQFSFGVDYRQQFYATSLRMIEARPLFGVGVGQYYRASALFLSPQLAWNYGMENAHNNFLQIGAELGLAGLVVFLAWIAAALRRTAAAVAMAPRDFRLLGAAAGIAAFIATWLGSHPLLVDEVAVPFWIQFGLVMALAGSVQLTRSAAAPAAAPVRGWTQLATAGVCLVAMAAAIRSVSRPIVPRPGEEIDGFYGWEIASDGTRFRWSREFASIFVPADIRQVSIPVRVPAEVRLPHPPEVVVMVGGVFQTRASVHSTWSTIDVGLAGVTAPSRFKRIDLRANRDWQPALFIPGSGDLRSVGVQVGESRLVTQR
jgi:hypothetical protein